MACDLIVNFTMLVDPAHTSQIDNCVNQLLNIASESSPAGRADFCLSAAFEDTSLKVTDFEGDPDDAIDVLKETLGPKVELFTLASMTVTPQGSEGKTSLEIYLSSKIRPN